MNRRILSFLFALALAACGDQHLIEHGFKFTLVCMPTHFSSWSTDRNGRDRDFQIGLLTYVFVPYRGGMFVDGKHIPMDFSILFSGCKVIDFRPGDSESVI